MLHRRSFGYRWFTDPAGRPSYHEDDRSGLSRRFVADQRAVCSRHGTDSQAGAVVEALIAKSPEFHGLWQAHEIGVRCGEVERIVHPELGLLELQCQVLYDADQAQSLLVCTATPGAESYEKLQLLPVLGDRVLGT
ncbi:hypothetical protein ACIP98_12575 [Streptomyces sp. NPDC088354]|uniref:MmyB family transcriptional regulator n=1 Tax=unclassified Streptomyces TaxID=2593676 RepID=UPI0029B87441|nr:hypothetical protein [Streptomyces sp. MI02-7b]MDX3072857.1 hypothetical protein [Streptomyces sp. MI02-7b]